MWSPCWSSFTWNSCELHMKLMWFSREIHLTLLSCYQFMWISCEDSIHLNLTWNLSRSLFAQFRWKSCEIHVKITWNNFPVYSLRIIYDSIFASLICFSLNSSLLLKLHFIWLSILCIWTVSDSCFHVFLSYLLTSCMVRLCLCFGSCADSWYCLSCIFVY